MSKKEPTIERVFTPEKIEVTSFIADGRTIFARKKKEAMKVADNIRSYFYEAYNDQGKHIGYAVPK